MNGLWTRAAANQRSDSSSGGNTRVEPPLNEIATTKKIGTIITP